VTAPARHPTERRRWWRHRAAIGLVLVASLLGAREVRAETVLSVLSYNVRGLPSLITRDDPRHRAKAIGVRARAYDVVMFQEDFEYHSILRRRMEDSIGAAGSGMVFDPRRLVAQILLAPVAAVLPHFSLPYGAGLSTFVKPSLALPSNVGRAPFRVCDGWLGAAFDCWASKGYLRVRIHAPEGGVIDVYSTHLDAGRGKRPNKTRRRQLRILADAIEKNSGNRPIIVGGDLNLDSNQPDDLAVMMEFRDRLQLHDSGAGPVRPFWKQRDYLLYRSGTHADIDVEQAGEALEFTDGSHALSDHPAVYARFRVSPVPRSAPATSP
jgi:hypothetical protein